MLNAFEQINISGNLSDNKVEKNSATVQGLEMYFQVPKLQCTKFSG